MVVGSGLFGAVFSYYALKSGKSVLVLEKRPHIGGNVYTELIEDIDVHRYGADVKPNIDYFDFIKNPFATSKKTVFTGAIDEFFGLSTDIYSTERCGSTRKFWTRPISKAWR